MLNTNKPHNNVNGPETPKQEILENIKGSLIPKYGRHIIAGTILVAVAALGFAVAKTLSDHDIEIVDLTNI